MAKRVAFVVLLAVVGIAAGVAGAELRERWQANDTQAVVAATTTTFAPAAPEPVEELADSMPVTTTLRAGLDLEDTVAALESGEAVCPFSDVPVPADGECPDERPSPVSEIVRRAAELEQTRALRVSSVEAEVGPTRREALALAQSGSLVEAIDVIDAKLAEDRWCNSIGTECSFRGTFGCIGLARAGAV